MNREEALKQSDEALKQLAEELQNGKSDALKKYLNFCSRFHRYSFGNCMLIAIQFPSATMVAGFNRWKEYSRFVKKGEKGIGIIAPLVTRSKKKDQKVQAEGQEPDDREKPYLKGFRVVYVFDISQTEGADVPALSSISGDPRDKVSRLEEVIRSKGIRLAYEQDLGGALGLSRGNEIAILDGMSPAETFSVLAHELAHELLHRGDRRSQTTKAMRETEAEAVSYVVCCSAGLEASSAASDYIQLWNGDLPLLAQSLELIRDVSAKIIEELEQEVPEEVFNVA